MIKRKKPWGLWTLMFVTFFLASLWMLVPLGHVLQWARPNALLLVLVYWLYRLPQQVHITGVMLLGLFNDLLQQSVFGMHALVLIGIAYLVLKLQRRLHFSSGLQQLIMLVAFSLIYVLAYYWVLSLVTPISSSSLVFISIIPTAICWFPTVWVLDHLLILIQPETLRVNL